MLSIWVGPYLSDPLGFSIPSKQAAHWVMTLAFMAGSNFKLKTPLTGIFNF
jgi:hypothetical protein